MRFLTIEVEGDSHPALILEDGKVHDFESNLIRRLAGLLYISDINCGNAKKRALNKITNNELG